MQSRILQIGRDEILLQTRAEILRQAGFTVEECLVTWHSESMHTCLERYFESCNIGVAENGEFHALMLCHTLDQEQAASIATEARCEAPSMKMVVLESAESRRLPPELYDAAVACKDGPAVLLRTINSLLANGRPGASRLKHLSAP
jgi:hypothetical protein